MAARSSSPTASTGAGQPAARRHTAARLDRHEAELAAHLAFDLAVAAGLGERERLVQHRRPLLVAAAHGMHQSRAERGQGVRQQCRVADAPRLGARLPQTRHAGLDGAGRDGCAAGVELAQGGRAIAARGSVVAAALVGGPAHAGVGLTSELTAEQPVARLGMGARGGDIAGPGKAPDEQLVGAVVEPVQA